MQPTKDNYFENARNFFLSANQGELIKKLSLRADEDYIYLRVLDLQYRIARKTGDIQKSSDGLIFADELSHDAALSIFDYLTWSREDRKLKGEFVSLKSMGYTFHSYLFEGTGGIYESGGKKFSGNAEKLESVCRRLKGQKMNSADVSYVIEVFDGFPLYFQFWEGDDEYPPKVFVLWDANTQEFIHYETAYYVMDMLLDRMGEIFDAI